MTTQIFTKEDWTKALNALADTYRIMVPVKEGEFHSFKSFGEGDPDFDYQNTRLSPKSLVYPPSEILFECTLDEEDAGANIFRETPKDYSAQAIVGIRPCDAHGFQIIKRNFENPEYRDPYWVRHFESTILVGLGCNDPCATCFCTSVGGGPFDESHLDILLYDMGDSFLAKRVTEKGNDFLDQTEGGDPADDAKLKDAENLAAVAVEKTNSGVPTDKLKEKVITELFDAPFWNDVAFACLNCGTCTFLCPTCWCFDVQDEVHGKQVDRIRNWDSCMFPLFTLHGSGHNPRAEKFQRVRQRFMHKLKYYVDKYEHGVQCSGCGRCVRYCPVNIDIRQVAELMNNY